MAYSAFCKKKKNMYGCSYTNLTRLIDSVHSHMHVQRISSALRAAVWPTLFPFNEHLINAADKWCGKNRGYGHRGSGEHINLITSKGMDPRVRSCSSSHTSWPGAVMSQLDHINALSTQQGKSKSHTFSNQLNFQETIHRAAVSTRAGTVSFLILVILHRTRARVHIQYVASVHLYWCLSKKNIF